LSNETLPQRLTEVLASLDDGVLAVQLTRIFAAAARAIERLSAVDLIPYESVAGEGPPDLSLWEEMAPILRDTVLDVNGFLTSIRQEFGEIGPDEDEPLGEPSLSDKARSNLRVSMQRLSQQVAELGERVRRPEVVADRWNLLAELQAFRTRFREQMGELVYETTSLFADVNRAEVSPGYGAEVRNAITVRATVTDLRRLLGVRRSKVMEASAEQVRRHGEELVAEMDTFGRTEAFKLLRAQDKRQIVELRRSLKEISQRMTFDRGQLLAILDGYLDFADTLSKVNNREFLIAHDREVWAALGVELEQAELARTKDAAAGARHLGTALANAQALYGRDGGLDAYLRRVRRLALGNLDAADLKVEMDKFRELLANLPMY
jgi:hypothetical protein